VVNTPTQVAIAQIFLDSVGRTGALLLLAIVMGAMFFSGLASVTANSRMMYAFARDGAIPGSRYWHRIHPTWRTPVNAVWCSVGIAAVLGLPYLANSTAFTAITSLATIGLYISYGIPILCRLLNPSAFTPGPFSLGRASRPVCVVACTWIAFITVLFVLPPVRPVTAMNMNYAVVAVGVVSMGVVGGWWGGARHWFVGPVANLEVAVVGSDAVAEKA